MEDQVGFDALDRPVIVLRHAGTEDEEPSWVWRYDDRGFEELELRGDDADVRRATVEHDRVLRVVAAERFEAQVAQQLTWRGREIVRVDEVTLSPYGGSISASAVTFNGDAQPERVLRAYRSLQGAPASTVADAMVQAEALAPEELVWDGRVRRFEPWPDDPESLIAPLATALDRALRIAAREANVAEPFCLYVVSGGHPLDDPPFPPVGRLAGVEYRDRMRSASIYDRAAIDQLMLGDVPQDVAVLSLVDHLDADALRACRTLSSALSDGPWRTQEHAAQIAAEVGVRLTASLNADALDEASEPFAALVNLGVPFDDRDLIDLLGRVVGAARAETFVTSISSTAPTLDRDAADALAEQSLTDRTALERLLEARGLEEHAGRLAHEVAAWGLRLVPPGEAALSPRSRLGGPCLLPPGTDWPTGQAGRPLSFLAGLDLAELGGRRVSDAMPDAGWLLFFADLDETADIYGEVANQPGAGQRVIYVDRELEPVCVEPPAALAGDAVLRHRRVAARPVLTLPSHYDVPERLGLDDYETQTYNDVWEQLSWALHPERRERFRATGSPVAGDPPGWGGFSEWRREDTFDVRLADPYEPDEPYHPRPDDDPCGWRTPDDGRSLSADHWVGGLSTGAQGHEPQPGTVLLLQLSDDESLGFTWGDAGVFQFRIPEAALAARDWSQVTLEADC